MTKHTIGTRINYGNLNLKCKKQPVLERSKANEI